MDRSVKIGHSDLSKLTKGAGVVFSGKMVGKAILFFYTIFLARTIGAGELGLYFLGLTIFRLVLIFSIAGLDVGVVRYVAIYRGRNDIYRMKGTVLLSAGITLVVSLILSLLMFFTGKYLAELVFHKPELGNVIRLFAISIPFESLMSIFLASTRGLKLMQYVAITENFILIGGRFLFAILFLTLGFGLKGVVIAYVVSSMFSCGLALFYASKHIPLFDQKIKTIFPSKDLIKFSIPMVFTMVVFDLMSHIDIFILGLFVSAELIGVYTVSVRLVTLAQVFFMAFQPIFQPFVAELHDKGKFEQLASLLKVLTQWSVIISLPVFLSLLLFSNFFLQFFGKDFPTGANCLSILVIAFIISSISNLPASIIFMAGRSDISLINNLIVLSVNVTLNYLLIPMYGIIGAAISTGISFVILCALRITEVYVLMRVHPFNIGIWKPMFAGAGAITLIHLLREITSFYVFSTPFILLPLFFLFYLSMTYFLGFNEEERYIGNLIKRKLVSIVK